MRALSSFFSITLGEPDLKNISLRDMLNLGDVSLHIDCQSKLFFSRFREFVFPDSNPIIFKTNNIFSEFLDFLESLSIFKYFGKNDDHHR